ncbi:MAG TPA: CHAD domain-containing protein, partial [Clostridiaceae bacterium]|nr:CHAD domain-containing protein [Clostridiaceae bacterium]
MDKGSESKMVQEIIFVRHGKAEDRSPNLPDGDRKLTSKGERELKALFSVLGPYLEEREKVKIWSSNLERASQTAAMLSREIGKAKVSFHGFIADGDFESFSKKAGRYGARLLVIVGHEPHLSDWTERITGARLDFRKGAAISIRLDTAAPLKGELQWQLNPEQFIDGEVCPQLTFAAEEVEKPKVKGKGSLRKEMDRLFMSCLKEIVEAHNEFMRSPEDPESVHKFRVKIRQFRSLVSFAKPELGQKGYENIQDLTRELAGEFTYLREVDVMAGKIKEGYPAFLSILRSERAKAEKEAYDKFASGAAAPLFFELLQWIEKDPFKNSKRGKKPLAGFTEARAEDWLMRFREGLLNLDYKDAGEIHALRIQGKKLRYMMSLMEPVLKENQAALIPGLKELQDRL